MFKRTAIVVLALAMVLSLVACSSSPAAPSASASASVAPSAPASASPSAAPASASPSSAPAADKKMAKLTVAGLTGEADNAMKHQFEMFTKQFPGVATEWVVGDTNTREQKLKTAISAGDPPTIGYYWGTRVNSFYNIGMCLDLKKYYDQKFFDQINKAMLQPCTGKGGEVFALPFTTVYHTTFYNKAMFDKYGFKEPETWDDLTKIFETLKKDGVFGFATNSQSMQDCLYGITYAELESKVGPGTAYGIANGDVSVAPGSPAGEVIRGCIEQVKKWYDAGYWYPGKGGINCSPDDANAAFAQGRCAMIFNFSGAYTTHKKSCEFEIGVFMKPTSKAGMKSYENIEPSVYFVPANCSKEQINTAVEFLKLVVSQEGEQAVVDANNIPAVVSYSYNNVSPILKEIMGNLDTGNLIAGINPTRTSSEMQTFIKQQIFAAPLGGTMTIDKTLSEMERIRLAVKK